MRNLKRALSLVLAMVMLLGMVMVPASAESTGTTSAIKFADADEIKYTDAVAITGGVGLFAGTDGKFLPKGTVTRAQMATIIVKMLNGADANADSFKGSGKFIDTAYFEGGWAEGYINWCSTLGIVAGYGDGTFRPGQAVTTAEAATMILNALKIDAGPGTWPTTVMAKATEEKIFEDLKPMPDTNTALTREELAVMALNGMNYSADGTNLYQVGDKKFDNATDAYFYIASNGGTLEVLLGKDSLSSKVFELKKMEGWITANQSTGEDYTEILNSNDEYVWFDLVTDENDLGHKVEVWYKDVYENEDERGTAYTLIDQFEYITLAEDAVDEREYRAAFGRKYDLNLQAAVDGSYNVKFDADAAAVLNAQATDYVANTSAPAGTYAIDPDTKTVCGYFAPVQYTAAKVGFVNTAAGQETITIGSLILENNEDADDVIEYDGIAKDDYVVYFAVQDVYVVSKMETVTGTIESYKEVDGKVVVKVDGKEYTESSAAGTIAATMTAADLSNDVFGQTYTFFLAPDGTFVCFVLAKENSLNLNGTVYLLGVVTKDERDAYGKKTTNYYARGVDMTGNEALVLIGALPEGKSLIGIDALTGNANDFYTVEENTDSKETRELGLFSIEAVPEGYDEENPTAPFVWTIPYGATGAQWEVDGEFEFGVGDKFTGNSSIAAPGSSYSYSHKNTKFVVVAGTAAQGYPLETAVYNAPLTLYFGARSQGRALMTRQAGNTDSIEALVFPVNNLDATTNATVIYAPQQSTVRGGKVEWGALTPSGTTVNGNTYHVFDALTGEPMDITLDESITSLPVGFYSVGYDSEEQMHKMAINPETNLPYKLKSNGYTNSTALAAKNPTVDGRCFENFMYDQKLTAVSGTNFWIEAPYASAMSSSGIKVIDIRSDAAIAASGIGKITSIDQIYAMKEGMPWVDVEFDLCYNIATSKIAGIFVEVYNNQAYGIDTLVYGFDYEDTEVTVVTGKMHSTGDVIQLPDGVKVARPGFYYLATSGNGAVGLMPATDLATTAGVAFGTASGLPGFDAIFNTTGFDALNTTAGFASYDVVEYQLLTAEGKTLLLVVGAGDEDASGVSAETPVDAADFDSVVDTTGNDITLDNLNAKQNAMCLVYTTYDMLSGDKLLVVADVDEGTVVDTKVALDAIDTADVINNSGADFETLAQLKTLVNNGYTFVAKKYEVGGETKLVVSQCMNANVVTGALNADSFAKDNVKLSGATTLAGTITVPAGENWLIDLAGQTLSGSVSPYFTVSGTLTVMDSVGGGKIQGYAGANKAMFVVENKMILEGGLLTGHDTTGTADVGAAVRVNKNATFEMTGGEISGNTAARGAGVTSGDTPNSNVTVTITGGVIENNNVTERAANVYLFQPAMLTIGGDAVIGAGMRNGAVSAVATDVAESRGGNVTISGGTIETFCMGDTGSSGVGAVGTITGAPVIKSLLMHAKPEKVTIRNLTGGASVTTTAADVLVVGDDTVQHTVGSTSYTCASGVLNIKVTQAVGGTISVSASSAMKDSVVEVTAVPDTGYELVEILVDGVAIDDNTFVVTKDHKVTATFALIDHNVTKGDETNGTFTLSAATANYGDTITITTAPATGFAVESVLVNGSASGVIEVVKNEEYTFTMPDDDVTVEVVFGQPSYNVSKEAATNGNFTVSPERAVAGTEITITATPAEGYEVDTITVTGASGDVTVNNNKFEMPAEDVTVTVTFKDEVPNPVAAADFVSGETLTLTKNSKLNAGITLPAGTYTLDLNGYTLSAAATPYFNVGSGVTLTIKDSGANGKVKGLASATDSMFKVTAGGQLTLQSGTLTGNVGAANGGAVNVNGGKFVMSGGTISDNSTTAYGGAIFLAKNASSSSTFEMSNGTITGNKSVRGGAISSAEATDANATISITGGEITGNDATARGATMHLFDTDVTISNGKFGWGTVDGANAAASHAETEFRANCVVNISGGTFDEIGTQSQPWTVNISGNPQIAKLIFAGGASECAFKVTGLTERASITLGAAANAAVTLETDDTVTITGTAGANNAVYSYNAGN